MFWKLLNSDGGVVSASSVLIECDFYMTWSPCSATSPIFSKYPLPGTDLSSERLRCDVVSLVRASLSFCSVDDSIEGFGTLDYGAASSSRYLFHKKKLFSAFVCDFEGLWLAVSFLLKIRYQGRISGNS